MVKLFVFAYAYLCLFYFGFLAYASLMNRGGWTKLTLEGKVFAGLPFLAFGLLDVVFNVTVGSLLFLQLPTAKTLTLSKRMKSNIDTAPGTWRGKLAAVIVGRDLLPFTKDY
jgi:hypothetical protein